MLEVVGRSTQKRRNRHGMGEASPGFHHGIVLDLEALHQQLPITDENRVDIANGAKHHFSIDAQVVDRIDGLVVEVRFLSCILSIDGTLASIIRSRKQNDHLY